jgi:coproporphyrinogen III oxidase
MVAACGAAVEAGGGRAHILPYANNQQQSTKNKQYKQTYIKKYKSHYYPTCRKYICSNYLYLFHFL